MDVDVNNDFESNKNQQYAVCKYCGKPECKQEQPGLTCIECNDFVHLKCLKRPGTPGHFYCDVFFEFTCAECSETTQEVFNRKRFLWVNVLLLTLHHLSIQSYGISNKGFFHYKTHICHFIDRNWVLLFGHNFKQKKNWVGTIAGALSVYNYTFFISGSLALGETGWWRLLHSFSPAVAAHINQGLSKEKVKGRPRGHMSVDKNIFFSKVSELGYKHLINDVNDPPVVTTEAVPYKKRRLDSEHGEPSSSNQESGFIIKDEPSDDITIEEHDIGLGSEADSLFQGLYPTSEQYPPVYQSDSSSIHSLQQSTHYYDSDSRSSPQHTEPQSDETDERTRIEIRRPPAENKQKKTEEKQIRRESLFSTQLNSVDLPWTVKAPEGQDLVEMTEYEEVQLLKRVEGMIAKVREPNKKAHLYRFRAKLALRRLKRHKHLPVFDLDKTVKLLSGYATEDARVVLNTERVLDRFQRSYLLDNLSGTIAWQQRGAALVSHWEATPFRSAYSGATLKPYIRRDSSASPLWLRLTDELLRRTHRHEPDYRPPPHASLDYSYVRPQHIAPVNSFLAQFFWPGIDVSEALQQPEYSCVVTYKKLVVGCAFLVPDVGHNEAYISFILTRPDWRNAKIATFMLYHLLQTCTGKDVTLHVSPTNPAIFLYQKFGFKVEELIQDFYEKYYDIDYKGCRHALFLRLIR